MSMIRLLAVFLLAFGIPLWADPPAKVFSHPDRIRYDGRCLTIDGRDTLILSGTFPYFRCPKALWRDRFQKIVASGCNAVETYVPWNWHERAMPASLDDFSQVDLTDLRDWLRMAHDEFGLYTIIRPGPYICAEWDGGGFPRWLLTKMPAAAKQRSGAALDIQSAAGADAVQGPRPIPAPTTDPASVWLRSDNPEFLAWSEHWLKAVCPVIAAEQVTRRPPGHGGVILFQIENEYDFYPAVATEERSPHLRALYQTAVAQGIEVPIFTCWTKQGRGSSDPVLSQVFDAFNSYPRYKIDATGQRIHDLQAAQPDAPVMISELGGGWFSAVGGQLSEDQPGLTPAELNAHTLLAIQEGATILNYYVLFGGTNFGLWPGRGDTTSYDYFAPIREAGGVGDKYLAVKAIGLMLQQHGEALARSRLISCQGETGSPDVTVAARRARNGDLYLFFRNHQVKESRRGTAAVWVQGGGQLPVDFDLGPFGFRIFFLPLSEKDPSRGEWLPKAVAGPPRPDHVPGPVRLTVAETRADSGGAQWRPVNPGEMLPELGVDDARAVLYATTLTLTAPQATAEAKLVLDPLPKDALAVAVNGHVVACAPPTVAQVGPWLREGSNAIEVLYDQIGQANIQKVIQDESGLRGAELVAAGGAIPLSDWKISPALGGIAANWPALGAGLPPGWTETPLEADREVARKGGLAEAPTGMAAALATWYRVEFELPATVPGVWVPWRALLAAAGDGEIFLNGHALGRYWEVGPQREYFLPESWLRFGPGQKNVLTLYLSPRQKGVSLRAVEIAPYAEQAEVR